MSSQKKQKSRTPRLSRSQMRLLQKLQTENAAEYKRRQIEKGIGITDEMRGTTQGCGKRFQTGYTWQEPQSDPATQLRFAMHDAEVNALRNVAEIENLRKQIKVLKFALALQGESVREVAAERDELILNSSINNAGRQYEFNERRIREQEQAEAAEKAKAAVPARR